MLHELKKWLLYSLGPKLKTLLDKDCGIVKKCNVKEIGNEMLKWTKILGKILY